MSNIQQNGDQRGPTGFWGFMQYPFAFFRDVLNAIKGDPRLATLWGFGVLLLVVLIVALFLGKLSPIEQFLLVVLITVFIVGLFVWIVPRVPRQINKQEDGNDILTRSRADKTEEIKLGHPLPRRQVAALIIGTIIFSGITYLTTDYTLLLPWCIFPILISVIFGPWAGLCVGGVGSFVGFFGALLFRVDLRVVTSSFALLWLCISIASLFTGLLWNNRVESYNMARTFGMASLISALGIAIVSAGLLLIRWGYAGLIKPSLDDLLSALLPSTAFSFFLLTILLVVYRYGKSALMG